MDIKIIKPARIIGCLILMGLLSEWGSPEQRGPEKHKGYHDRDVWYFPPDYIEKLKIPLLQRRK